LRAFVQSEFAVQRRAVEERAAQPQPERVEHGTCWDQLTFARLADSGCAVFRHGGNDSKLREGDAVRLNRGRPAEGIPCFIYREEPNELWLKTEDGFRPSQLSGEPGGWMIDEDFIDLEGHYLEALDRLGSTHIGQHHVLPLLMGRAHVGLNEESYAAAHADVQASGIHWEEAQHEALAACLAADGCYLVQGPPGTGKTRVLAAVVASLVERGERVLVTAFTHRAIDNALGAIASRIGDRDRAVRFGFRTHRRNEGYDVYDSFADSPLAGLAGGWAAAATPFALRKRLPGVEFDTIVIDEAGQMTAALAVMALVTGRNYLLFGDDQQLGPVVVSRSRREAANCGIFHWLKHHASDGTRLDVTYRLNTELARWPSEQFYHGELTPSPAAANRRLAWHPPPNTEPWVHAALDPENPLVWIPFPLSASRTSSQGEIAVAARLVQALADGGIDHPHMAVVTPYRRQARLIRRRLESLSPRTCWRDCLLDTVERMQGQERDVIVLSLSAADPEFIRHQFDFLFDPRRLNVAATRARTKLLILASRTLRDHWHHDSDAQEEVRIFRALLDRAVAIPAPDPA